MLFSPQNWRHRICIDGVFARYVCNVNYAGTEGVFATNLDQARDVASCRPLVSAPGGRNSAIVLKTRDFALWGD